MNHLNKAWEKIALNEHVIVKMANLAFTEKDWYFYFKNQETINADILLDMLYVGEVITLDQRNHYIIKQEWTTERRMAMNTIVKVINPSLSSQDRIQLRIMTRSIAILENRVDALLNKR